MGLGDPQPDLIAAASPETSTAAPAGDRGDRLSLPKPEEAVFAPDAWDDDLALAIVIADFDRASQHRQQNFDINWDDDDRLLHANVVQRTWEGTNTPRSSLGVKLVWQQVESLLPAEMTALFQTTDGIFFDTFPRPGTDPSQAVATRELLSAQLDDANIWKTMEQVLRSKNLYGTGIMKLGWKRQERKRAIWADMLVPLLGEKLGMKFFLGEKRVFKQVPKPEQINRPDITYVSLRDFYIDPSHKHPEVNGAQFAMQRAFSTMDELYWMGQNDPSYSIPSQADMILLVKQGATPASAAADTSKQRSAMEADIRERYPLNSTADPAKAKFEVIEYWTDDRLVTVLNRRRVIRNIANPYGFIPFLSVNYTDVVDQFYGKGIARIIGDEQRLMQGIVNSHVDEVALKIHSALVVQSGSVLNKGQLRTRPGQVIEATNVESVKELERTPVTQDAFIALQQAQIRAQQYTGVTDIVSMGAPSVQTSATRTARGVSTIANAAFSRIQHIVNRDENSMIVPMLDKLLELNQRFLDPRTEIQILGKTIPGLISVNPLLITNGQFRFELRAASRMAARQAMQQSLPFVLQSILNPGVMQALTTYQTKPNMPAIMRDVTETLGWRNRNDWFVPMSPQEVQMAQQPNNVQIVKELIKSDRDKAKNEAKGQMMEGQQVAELLREALKILMKGAVDGEAMPSIALGRALDQIGAHTAFEDNQQAPEGASQLSST